MDGDTPYVKIIQTILASGTFFLMIGRKQLNLRSNGFPKSQEASK